MARQTPMQRVADQLDDPDGVAWHDQARAAWDQAGQVARAAGADDDDGEAQLAEYNRIRPDLPSWSASDAVSRELFGRFVHDRDSDLVHDVTRATADCDVDAIRNGTFVHFARELPDALPDTARPCGRCMGDG